MTSDLPSYSPDGLIGLSVMYSDWAHSIFYFEDRSHEVVYERLLKRLVPRLRPFAVACTGGKAVSRRVAERRGNAALPCVVVVDKDYDDLLGEFERYNKLDIIYLRRHSLENYLANVEALLEIAVEVLSGSGRGCQHRAVVEKVSDRFDYMKAIERSLLEVARRFVVVRRNRLELQTTKLDPEVMFDGADSSFPLPDDWFKGYCDDLVEQIRLHADWMLEGDHLDQAVSTAFNTDCRPWGELEPSAHVVGKHYLFGLLTYLDARLGTSLRGMQSQELYIRIVSHLDLGELAFLKDEIHRVLRGSRAIGV